MKAPVISSSIAVFSLLLGCGPSAEWRAVDAAPQGTLDADLGPVGKVSGTVWAPGNGPGQVPAGHEIPVAGALVYLSANKPEAIPAGAYCEACIDAPGGVLTDANGAFEISPIVPNTYWLIMQKGQFRLEQQIEIAAYQKVELSAAASTLPSAHDPAAGRWIPRIAVAVGDYDKIEQVLGKMGIGQTDSLGQFDPSSSVGRFDIYENGSWGFDAYSKGTLTNLVSNLDTMLQYHIIFIPCSDAYHATALYSQQNLRNIRDYVAAGGKLYVTDWSGEWADNVFPAQMELAAGEDTPASAYNAATDSWNTSLFGTADGDYYNANHGEAVDNSLHAWLEPQSGPFAEGDSGEYTASDFDVVDNWNVIEELHQVQLGVDDEGMPVFDNPRAWIVGDRGGDLPKKPLTVTFQPSGCGRVLFSTYHTTPSQHPGLVPQERVLLYLIMEIGVCSDVPVVD